MKDRKLQLSLAMLLIAALFTCGAVAVGTMPVLANGAAPVVQPLQGATVPGVAIELPLTATDADNDVQLFQLTEQPRLGAASIDGQTLVYMPGEKTGTDKFGYTAVDANGNTANAAQVSIQIEKNRAKLTYADMQGNPSHYAAIKLAESGIMEGEHIGDCAFFRPTQSVTRSEFIAMAAAVAELPVQPTTQTDFLDDSGLSAWAKPYVSAAAANGLVSGYQTASGLAEIRGENPITLAEASVVINNLLTENLDDVRLTLELEHSGEMNWAQAAMSSLSRLDVLSPLAQMQASNAPITRQTACEMLYQALILMED